MLQVCTVIYHSRPALFPNPNDDALFLEHGGIFADAEGIDDLHSALNVSYNFVEKFHTIDIDGNYVPLAGETLPSPEQIPSKIILPRFLGGHSQWKL